MKRSLVSMMVFLSVGLSIACVKIPTDTYTHSAATVRPSIPATMGVIEAAEATPTPIPTPDPTPEPTPTPTPKPTIAPTPRPTEASNEYRPTGGGITGYVSYYSRAGCLGCDPNFITASGEPLDDTAFTLAVVPGQYDMGQMVLVTNLSNSRQTIAKVNDTGGFAQYNRIADLSLALYEYLNAKTDDSLILIEPVTK